MADKPTLQPPSQPRTFAADPHESRLKRRALIIFIVLALIALAVVVVLPGLMTPAQEQPRGIQTQTVQPDIVRTDESPLKAAEARELQNKTLERKARLDNDGVKIWGADTLDTSYGQAMALLAEANRSFDDQRFDRAAQGYQETIAALEQLEASRPERVQRSLQAGSTALDQLDSTSAKQHYEIARAADADNSEALLGLQRAETLPQVLAYIAQGQTHEGEGNLDSARQMYASARALDTDCKPAQEHLQRVEDLIAKRDFQGFMSKAMTAFNDHNLTQARQALNSAKKIRPEDAAVLDLDRQLKNAGRSAELQRLGREAVRHEQAEQWEQALGLYNQALKIDAQTGFAQQGKARAGKLVTLNREVQHYLSSPDDLQASEHRAHARNLCDTAIGPE